MMYINANAITFFIHLGLQQRIPQMIFISRHSNLENFIQIDQKLLEL